MVRALLVAALLVTSCEGTKDPSQRVGCTPELLRSPDPAVMLPPSLPMVVSDPALYERQQIGATTLYFAQTEGDDVVELRDRMADAYEKAGKAIESRDEEPPAEAEFQFSTATEEGSVQVTPVCQDRLRIRWRIGPR